MATKASKSDAPPSPAASSLVLLAGDDEFAVKQQAKQLFEKWCAEAGGFDHEMIEATAGNSGEALNILGRLREALQTLPFFGSSKVIWLQNCNFLGDERAATSQAVTQSLNELAQELKAFPWEKVRLLITTGKVDKRRAFYKTVEKTGTVEFFNGWSTEDKNWASDAEATAAQHLTSLDKTISDEALARLVVYVGPNSRQLNNEVEKLALYAGKRSRIELADVETITTRNKQSKAFALADAVGARDLARTLKTLDEELWEVKIDPSRSEIGVLYALISKVRAMIFTKEMFREGLLKQESEYFRFKTQLAQISPERFPDDRRFNPLQMNAYVLFRALEHCKNYALRELIEAMDLLLQCNQSLIFSNLDEAIVLQQTLVRIVNRAES